MPNTKFGPRLGQQQAVSDCEQNRTPNTLGTVNESAKIANPWREAIVTFCNKQSKHQTTGAQHPKHFESLRLGV